MERRLRKRQDALYITACGVLILSLWSIVKMILFLVLDRKDFDLMLNLDGTEVAGFENLVVFLMFFFLAIDLAFRFYVFRKAIKDARGKKKVSPVYIVFACIFAGMSIYSVIYFFTPGAVMVSWTDAAVSILVELTSLATSVELIYSAIVIRKLRRTLGIQTAQKQTKEN